MTHAVIMAGGIGSRFWPRSRKARPKQFLNVFGEATLIQNTVARLQGVVEPEHSYVVTNARYVETTAEQLPSLPAENILAEPLSKNTAPCILYSAMKLAARDPDATMVVLPADHVITNVARFQEVLRVAIDAAQENGALVTIGIEPTHPATGYGYIQFEASDSEALEAHRVRTFAEKPDMATAERFLDSGDFLWNSGMFVWRAQTIIDAIERLMPDLAEAFSPVDGVIDTPEESAALVRAFSSCKSISIDYGVMERAEKVYVVPGTFGWSDVGDWRAVYDLSPKDKHGNAITGQAVMHSSSRCLVSSDDRLIVLVGMHDAMVIDTGDAVLVCNRDNAQQVKAVVDYLDSHQLGEHV
ncbi:MAG: mannose-1-phosphate guanylyltransferase [Rhodothermales bacterium]|nr:mannose-1-phosphate guanylyltransferase [Rhodothermales bacterium]MBO6781347.1 mannose-1-phosphate guanylyltransferase [Rhodothermales bacterium]